MTFKPTEEKPVPSTFLAVRRVTYYHVFLIETDAIVYTVICEKDKANL